MSSADVKSILDSLSVILPIELSDGNIVDLGELGRFRASVSSSGAATDEEFSVAKRYETRQNHFHAGKIIARNQEQPELYGNQAYSGRMRQTTLGVNLND